MDHSRFDDLCYAAVTELKEKYPDIRRIKYRIDHPGELRDYVKPFFLSGFEDNICPKGLAGAGRAAYVKRNQAMITASDVCVFYYDESYLPNRRKVEHGLPLNLQYKSRKNNQFICRLIFLTSSIARTFFIQAA